MTASTMRIGSLRVTVQAFSHAVHTLMTWAQEPALRYVCTCNAYTSVLAHEQPALLDALNHADMVTADGMPLVWLQRRKGHAHAERVYGPDILLALCERTQQRPIKHYFYGAEDGIAEQLAARLQSEYPDLQVAGYESPPQLPDESLAVDPQTVARLNASGAAIIWVGLGTPKQDLWMAAYRPHLQAPLLIGVGAAFDFLSGNKAQAPRWMQRRGLEWLFRLLSEPQRLWRRYLVYNTRFLWLVARQRSQP